jgi:chromosome segregation ATPase
MYFVAGLLVAGLVMMLILPAFWRRALRLSEKRARLQTPLSVNEAIAERDQLRADQAVARRRLERRVEALQAALARQRVAYGREVKRAALDQEKANQMREIADLRDELAGAAREAVALEADLGASRLALHDLSARLDRSDRHIALLRDGKLAFETRADEYRAAIAASETRAAGLEARLADQTQALKLKPEALEAARARETREKFGAVGAPAQNQEGDRALREAIAKLGADVLRLARQGQETSRGSKSPAPPLKRENFTVSASGDKNKDDSPPPLRRARTTSAAP